MAEPLIVLSYLAIGALAGLLAGLLGVGGGLIIVPLLSVLFFQLAFPADTLVQCAVATSLSTIVITSMVSFYSHYKHGAVIFRLFWQLSVGVVIGAVMGAWIASRIESHVLKGIFGVFELIVALYMVANIRPKEGDIRPGILGNGLVGIGIGVVSALLGIGGGTMTVPYLTWYGQTIHKAVGTSSALGLPLAIAGTLSFVGVIDSSANLPANNMGYVHIPAFVSIGIASTLFAPLGVRIAHRTSTEKLRLIFALFLVVLGVSMLLL